MQSSVDNGERDQAPANAKRARLSPHTDTSIADGMTGVSSMGYGTRLQPQQHPTYPHFPIEDIIQHPLPGYVAPAAIAFSPDDKLISYLYSPEGTLNRKLFVFDPETRLQRLLVTPPGGGVEEGNISKEEQLRRERLRERGLGVTRYDWSKRGAPCRLLVPLPAGVFIQDGVGAELRLRVLATPGSPILDPQLAPDGSTIAYVRDDELFVVSATSGEPQQLTFGAKNNEKEEMERRTGFWWAPDSKSIAFAEVDSAGIPSFRIMHQGKPEVGPDAEEDHAYPFAGEANVKVRLGVVPAAGGDVVWMDLLCGGGKQQFHSEEYLARVCWLADGGLVAQVENREQSELRVVKFDARTGAREELFLEHNGVWINLHDCFTPLQKNTGDSLTGGFLWASEATGFRHLALYDAQGMCLGELTSGDWMVEQVAGVDEDRELVYFTGTRDSALETHLYACKMMPDIAGPPLPPRRLTQGAGRHTVVLDHAVRRFVDVYDSLVEPPSVRLHSLDDGQLLTAIYVQPQPNARVSRLQLQPPQIVDVLNPEDQTTVFHAAIYRPDVAKYGPGPYKTVVSVYGGPHVQTVCNTWMTTVDMRAQYLRSRGILVFKLDNRGSARRGLLFEGAIKYSMGRLDVEDQVLGVQYLLQEGLADPDRIGIYGWSYGGYMAAMALARWPTVFRCAVAGAPVTSWDGYDTHYTERYMGHPDAHAAGYEWSAVMHHAGSIQGKLLLVHGMIDENVHFRHTARLINALTAAAKEYELLLFPDERHMPRGLRDRMYMEERIFSFLDRNLK
eukprot:jgi/Mesen1/7912/ME000420S07047